MVCNYSGFPIDGLQRLKHFSIPYSLLPKFFGGDSNARKIVGSMGKNQKIYIFTITMQDNQFFIVVIQRDMILNYKISG
ncbi:hypothetical protein [Okeania sp. SIO2B3]|uniref:hypothetical protein n=1 Tax=Okeania sp. SIO2B3 TaxID=2607784 RepID=UPI0013C1B728|nr:hypothetical protein [Okeania sp. SIO2B3]NET43712.1 hypothetical protein [Okeania sp. SIO2B3]